MYANIFNDVVIDNRRMKKRATNNTSVQELVEEKEVVIKASTPSATPAPSPKYSQTSTTVVFTPGNNKMEQAMGVKMVADELLAATGTVLGASAGIFSSVASKKPANVLKYAKAGEQLGRTAGGWMWSAING